MLLNVLLFTMLVPSTCLEINLKNNFRGSFLVYLRIGNRLGHQKYGLCSYRHEKTTHHFKLMKRGYGGVLSSLGNFMESTIYIFSKSFYLFWMLRELHLYLEFFCILNKIPKIWKVNQLFRWMLGPASENNLRIFLDIFCQKMWLFILSLPVFGQSFSPLPLPLII